MPRETKTLVRLRDLAVDGLLLTLPIAVALIVASKVVAAIVRLFAPLSGLLPQGRWFGIALLDLVAIVVLALALVVIGAFAQTSPGRRISESLERIVLRKIPGYLLFKSVASGFTSEERETGFKPALVSFDDNTVLGFIVEQPGIPDGMVTVFVPASPTPAAGNVVLVPRSRVLPLDVPVSSALYCVGRLGLGLQKLISADSVARRKA